MGQTVRDLWSTWWPVIPALAITGALVMWQWNSNSSPTPSVPPPVAHPAETEQCGGRTMQLSWQAPSHWRHSTPGMELSFEWHSWDFDYATGSMYAGDYPHGYVVVEQMGGPMLDEDLQDETYMYSDDADTELTIVRESELSGADWYGWITVAHTTSPGGEAEGVSAVLTDGCLTVRVYGWGLGSEGQYTEDVTTFIDSIRLTDSGARPEGDNSSEGPDA